MPKRTFVLSEKFQIDSVADLAAIEKMLLEGVHPDQIRHPDNNQPLLPYLCDLRNSAAAGGLPHRRAAALLQLVPRLSWAELPEFLETERMQAIAACLAEPQAGIDYTRLLYADIDFEFDLMRFR